MFFFFLLQACDGTISQLRSHLVEMSRFDAVNIIDKAMEKGEEGNAAEGGEGSSSSQTNVGKSAPGELGGVVEGRGL